ncbi:MAG: 4-alpha-glucanotransferase [Acidobacteriota bacterium]
MTSRFLRSPDPSDPEAPRERRAGVLLHPTSLPGPYGIGDLGRSLDRFLDWAARAGQTVWQVLPLGPPAFGGVPYTCLSACAGNPALLSPERLRDDGLIDDEDLASAPVFGEGRVDFATVLPWKNDLLRRAHHRFREHGSPLGSELDAFVGDPAQRSWLDDWARFAALKERQGGRPWFDWDAPIARRDPEALAAFDHDAEDAIDFHRFVQWLFARQWGHVRSAARDRGIAILGDVPIYVAHDSADVWAHRHLFDLGDDGRPLHVAGVPPDYFSETGQLWGNPLYRWDRLDEEGYGWWIERLRANFRQTDMVRLDHFRAFADYWQIPGDAENAIGGAWRDGPGRALFDALDAALGPQMVVAEDLGELSDAVHALRRELDLPGMRVLHFGFGHEAGTHTPHRFEPATVVYTGTHDNNTTVGWYHDLDDTDRDRFHRYTASGPQDVHWTMIRVAHSTVADLAIVPIQDVLGLDASARMNVPGEVGDANWTWRLQPGQLDDGLAERLRGITEMYERHCW